MSTGSSPSPGSAPAPAGAEPPEAVRRDRRHHLLPLALAGAAAAGVLVLRLRDPHVPGAYGTCPFLTATGLPCPACGGLRAVNDLANGDVGAALSSNAFLVASLAVVVVVAGVRTLTRRPPASDRVLTWTALLWLFGLLAFGVLRWLPALSDLQP